MDRENTCGIFLTNSFTRPKKEEKKEEKKEAREQERNNGRLFRKLFSADCRDSSSLFRTKMGTRGGEGVLKRRRKSEYKQNRERKDGERRKRRRRIWRTRRSRDTATV